MIRPAIALALSLAALPLSAAAEIPAHPNDLKYQPLAYEAPNRERFRHVLGNGVPVYVVEDHGLPLVEVTVTARGGSYLDPAGKEGLAGFTADQMRSGGAGDLDADAFDQKADFLAVDVGVSAGPRESTARVNSLSKDLDAALDLLFLALKRPRFQQDRMDLYRTQVKQALEHRNDDTSDIELREWKRLIYGDHFEARQATTTALDSITRDDLVAFHGKVWSPANLIIAVTGDVKTADALARLEKRFAGWSQGARVPDPPKPTHVPPVGVFVVDKPDVPQTRVSVGHLATTWDDPRRPSLEVMNEILGGGGFTSRIVKRVRSDEGLAYSAGSVIGFGRTYPQSFRVGFQSENKSVARAVDIVLAELDRIRKEDVGAGELDIARSAIVESFPQRFATASAKAAVFVDDELTGRPADYWQKYRGQIQAVNAASLREAAQQFLHPDKLTILAVGKVDDVLRGDPDHVDHSLAKTAGATAILAIPLPEPGTLKYPHPPQPVSPPAR